MVAALWLALRRRGPPELEPWRVGLIAIATLNVVVAAFVYPYLFGVVVLWTWTGIVYGGRFLTPEDASPDALASAR